MPNTSSMRIEPVSIIIRKCSSLKRLLEVIDTMNEPIINIEESTGYLLISATNSNGVCIYHYKNEHYYAYSLPSEELQSLWQISQISEQFNILK